MESISLKNPKSGRDSLVQTSLCADKLVLFRWRIAKSSGIIE